MTGKIFTNERSRRKGLLCTRQMLALLLALVMMTGTAMAFVACGNKAEEAEADLTETETISADSETTTDDAEEETGEVSEEDTEDGTEGTKDEGNSESEEAADSESNAENESRSEAESSDYTDAANETTNASTTVKITSTDESEEVTGATTASSYTYTAMDTIMYTKQAVNVRSIPSKSGDLLGSVSADTPVQVTGQCNETGWYRIGFNGGAGYVSNNYLTTTRPSETTTTTTATATTKKNESSTTTKKSTETTTTVAETTTTAASTTTRTYATEAEKLAIIEGINDYRTKKGYTEMPVVLNTYLTESAQAWADYLAANDLFEHSDYTNGNYYESIHRGYIGGLSNIIGYEEAVWQGIGSVACVHASIYECPFIGVGVAVDSEGYSIVVIQGFGDVALYDDNGYFVSSGYWRNSDEWAEIVETYALHLYEIGHFADFIGWKYYYDLYGDDDYLHIPSWLKGSTSWVS